MERGCCRCEAVCIHLARAWARGDIGDLDIVDIGVAADTVGREDGYTSASAHIAVQCYLEGFPYRHEGATDCVQGLEG